MQKHFHLAELIQMPILHLERRCAGWEVRGGVVGSDGITGWEPASRIRAWRAAVGTSGLAGVGVGVVMLVVP
jgi:hypothetical protein